MPDPIIVVANINGQPARALLDRGCLADLISANLVRQLVIEPEELAKQIQGSRAKTSTGCRAELQYQTVKAIQYFDIVNLLHYDLILDTPFFYQHKVNIGFNPTTVLIGSDRPLPIVGSDIRALESRAAEVYSDQLEKARQLLRDCAKPIASTDASDTPLPPLREINHQIPLKDTSATIPWRSSRCPEALRGLWAQKRDAYLKTGRWRMSNARNTSPMLLLTKPGSGVRGIPPRLKCVVDLRERNKNTQRITSPLPDMEGILRGAQIHMR